MYVQHAKRQREMAAKDAAARNLKKSAAIRKVWMEQKKIEELKKRKEECEKQAEQRQKEEQVHFSLVNDLTSWSTEACL